jgi:acyl dehydratase
MIEWFDDLAVGMRFRSSEKVITREDIKHFATEFDPQPYHLDETAAELTPLKGLAASGWHTAAIAVHSDRTLCWALASTNCGGLPRCGLAMPFASKER